MGQATMQQSRGALPDGQPTKKGSVKRRWRPTFVQVVLGVPIIYMTLIYPVLVGPLLARGVTQPQFGFHDYVRPLTDPVILQVLWITLRIAVLVAVASVIRGHQVAYLISRQPPQRARILTMLVIIPVCTSVL